MKLLFCVEFYYPSVGGAQEVVRQIAERLAARGHDVTVATTQHPHRKGITHNNVHIKQFPVSGNLVNGMRGAIESYRSYLEQTDADVIFFYAAQQWTFDAAWEVMPNIKARKVLVPCGYSGLYLEAYAEYFRTLPTILKQMDAVVYHAKSYRDIDFADELGLVNSVIIPNGAALEEFDVELESSFRNRLTISKEALVLLTIGTITGLKGHYEIVRSFALAEFGLDPVVLILNGNSPEKGGLKSSKFERYFQLMREYGVVYASKHAIKMVCIHFGFSFGNLESIDTWVSRINCGMHGNKRVLKVDLDRSELIQAYLQSNLFVFASNVEYSPLVLYEACAAGLPFLSVPVGNSREIVEWTKGGVICEAPVDDQGYTRVDPSILAHEIQRLVADEAQLKTLGNNGKLAAAKRFNWASISLEYERLFEQVVK